MKASLSWLNQYVSIDMDASDLADALTMAGLEVESVTDRYEYLNTVLVGRIVEIVPHPNAQRLTVCKVDAGDRLFPVVCGAPNVEVNMLAPLALTAEQMVIGSVVLAMFFPCVATFVVLVRELGVIDMLKSAGIMIAVALLTGGILNLVL